MGFSWLLIFLWMRNIILCSSFAFMTYAMVICGVGFWMLGFPKISSGGACHFLLTVYLHQHKFASPGRWLMLAQNSQLFERLVLTNKVAPWEEIVRYPQYFSTGDTSFVLGHLYNGMKKTDASRTESVYHTATPQLVRYGVSPISGLYSVVAMICVISCYIKTVSYWIKNKQMNINS